MHQQKEEDIIYGMHPVISAIQARKEIVKIFIQRGISGENVGELRKLVKQHNIVAQNVPIQKLNQIKRKNHQGVIAFISPIEFYTFEGLLPVVFEQGKMPLFLMLDGVSDVRNFGAICRSAEAAGVDGIIVPEKGSAMIHSDAMKTSAGALNHIPICRVKNLEKTIKYASDSGLKIIACTEKTEKPLYEVDMTGPLLIIMGSEENGIAQPILKSCDEEIYIPMSGKISSLNVSVATAISIYEAVRQRGLKKDN